MYPRTNTVRPEPSAVAALGEATPAERRPDRAAVLTVATSAGYGLLALFWALGGPGYPYGVADPQSAESVLGPLGAASGSVVLTMLGLAGALVGVPIVRGNRNPALLVLAGLLALALLVVLPDRRLLTIVAYLPLLVGSGLRSLVTGAPMPDLGQSAWTLTHLGIGAMLGLLWLVVALRAPQPRLRRCRLANPELALRIGRRAVVIAVAVPVIYAATRWTWALGIPLGISEEFHAEGAESGLWLIGAMLGSLGLGGAILTLGLVQRWGERYPGWIWWRRGRRVPPMLAVVPASIAAALVTSAGVAYWRMAFTLPEGPIEWSWSTLGPELLWPAWGLSLAVATWTYWIRRRATDGDHL